MHVHVPVRERARDDAVVVAGIALRGHDALPAARRAALVVRVVERLGVEHVDEPLRLHGHVVQRAIREVDDLLGVPEREHAARAVGRRMPRVRRGRRIAAPQRGLHVAVALDRAGPAAVADGEELAVPVLRRQPQLDVDVRVRRRLQHERHAAMLRNRLRRRAGLRRRSGRCVRGLEQPRGDVDGARDRRALELDALELGARHVQRSGRGDDDGQHGSPFGRPSRPAARARGYIGAAAGRRSSGRRFSRVSRHRGHGRYGGGAVKKVEPPHKVVLAGRETIGCRHMRTPDDGLHRNGLLRGSRVLGMRANHSDSLQPRCLPYSTWGTSVACAACGRATNHDWSTVSKAQQLFREHFAERG